MSLITPTQLQAIMSTLGHSLPTQYAERYTPLLIEACEEWGVNTRLRLAALLGIIGYESGGLTVWSEIGGASQAYAPYYGRGPIQLTWEGNYRALGAAYGTPEKFVDNPDLIATPEWGFKAACWFWRRANGDLNTFADAGDFWDCYLRVAGADNGTFPQRKQIYEQALSVLSEGDTKMVTGADIVKSAKKLLGTPYRVWHLGDSIPMWLDDGRGDPPPVSHLQAVGVECSDLVNFALEDNGLSAGGGTESFADYLVNTTPFDPSAPGEPGAIAFTPYTGPALSEQGHIALFVDKHTLVQALFRDGVTDAYSDVETYNWGGSTAFTIYGFLPGVTYQIDVPTPAEEQLWRKFGWYEAINAQWDLKWRPPTVQATKG